MSQAFGGPYIDPRKDKRFFHVFDREAGKRGWVSSCFMADEPHMDALALMVARKDACGVESLRTLTITGQQILLQRTPQRLARQCARRLRDWKSE